MKKLLYSILFLTLAAAVQADEALRYNFDKKTISDNIKIGSGKSITLLAGSQLIIEGGSGIVGNLPVPFAGLTGTPADNPALTAALDLRALSSSLAAVATSGAYADLTGRPTLGTAAGKDVGTGSTQVAAGDAPAAAQTAAIAAAATDATTKANAAQAAAIAAAATDATTKANAAQAAAIAAAATDATTKANAAQAAAIAAAATDATTKANAAQAAAIAAAATDATTKANAAQAAAVLRANHTGTQSMSTISDAGNSATRSVGTTAGTVAAGDDPRFAAINTATQSALDLKAELSLSTNAQSGTTYTFVLGDAGKVVTLNNGSAITATIPPNSSVAFPVGTRIWPKQLGAGVVTLAAGGGVTITQLSTTLCLGASGHVASLFKTATDTWELRVDILDGSAAADPTTAADTAAGYQVGSVWRNTSSGALFYCVSNSASAASWTQINNFVASTGTFDSATGTLKFYSEEQFNFPDQVDGTGCTRVTTEGATYGTALFSNSADQAANYCIWRWRVPADLDTGTDLTAALTFRLAAGDTGKHRYVLSMADVASSASADSPTFSQPINIDFTGDGSGASGDIEQVAAVALAAWRSNLTAGHILVMKLARDGDDGTNDTSTQNSNLVNLAVKAFHSQ